MVSKLRPHRRDDYHAAPAPGQTPPPRPKTTISISGLFEGTTNHKDLRKRRIDSSESEDEVDAKRRRKLPPVNAAAEELFAGVEAPAKHDHLVFRDFDGIASRYEESMQARSRDKLQRITAELDARARGLDIHGNPIHRPGVPTTADLEQLEGCARIINQDLSDETLMIQLPQGDGSKIIRQTSLREIIEAFQKLDAEREKQLVSLENELVVLKAEIATAYESLHDDSKDARIQGIKDRYEREQAELNKAIDVAKAELAVEMDKVKAEETAMNAEKYRQVVELLRPVQ